MWTVRFSREFLKKFRKTDIPTKKGIKKMAQKLESEGPTAGKILTPIISEIKRKKPPL